MKRTAFFFSIIILALGLAACSPRFVETPAAETPAATQPAALPDTGAEQPQGQPAQPAASPTPIVEQPAVTPEQPAATPEATQPTGVVKEDGLNLRRGPGFDYPVMHSLPKGERLEIQGRSENGVWLAVKTSDGSGGWVFAGYVESSVAAADLPVSEAYGGPIGEEGNPPAGEAPAPTPLSMTVVIVDREARLSLRRFPAGQNVTVWLGRAGRAAELEVASGRTDASGAAEIVFEMPDEWNNGDPLVEENLALVAATEDGGFSRMISVEYVR